MRDGCAHSVRLPACGKTNPRARMNPAHKTHPALVSGSNDPDAKSAADGSRRFRPCAPCRRPCFGAHYLSRGRALLQHERPPGLRSTSVSPLCLRRRSGSLSKTSALLSPRRRTLGARSTLAGPRRNSVLCTADGVLDLALGLVRLAVSLQLGVACRVAETILKCADGLRPSLRALRFRDYSGDRRLSETTRPARFLSLRDIGATGLYGRWRSIF